MRYKTLEKRIPLFLAFIAGVACSLAIASYVSLEQNVESLDDDRSLAILRERLTEIGPLSVKQRKILASEMRRVKKYEQRLRKRADALDALLGDTLELDTSADAPLMDDISFEEGGIGGAIEPIAPIVSQIGVSKRIKNVTKVQQRAIFHYPSDTLHRIDSQLALLRRIPIGAPSMGRLSSGFGNRRSPFSGRVRAHKGVDFAMDRRSPVLATGNGIVEKAGYMRGYGLVVVINHGNGFETVYGHLSEIQVTAGQSICRGERIGLLGSTGRSTGPHVHYEVRLDGTAIDPMPFVELLTFLRLV